MELRGLRWLVIVWEAKTGRKPSALEMQQARAPYRAGVSRREREHQQVPDELLADQEAVELARLEQQREPPDLIGRVAA